MMRSKSQRVMWLLNHTTLRNFEIQQLQKLRISEIFVPKKFPYDEGNLSASVTYEYDGSLSLTPSQIALLNAQDWYGEPELVAWDLVNKYFDFIFIGFFPRQIISACLHFKGAIVLRAFGLGGEETYSKLIRKLGGGALQSAIIRAGKRFRLGMGYMHLVQCEDEFIADNAVFMPVGLKNINISDQWVGSKKNIFFVCPRIGSSQYFHKIYCDFLKNFMGLSYCVGGAQPIAVNDENVLGFVDSELLQ